MIILILYIRQWTRIDDFDPEFYTIAENDNFDLEF